jgi:DHA2 family multidrug resistance protein
MSHKTPVITLSIFSDRNFTLSTILLALYCGCLFGFVTLQPIMLENLFHYTTMLAGDTMIAIGLSSAVSMGLSSFLMSRFNVKIILTISILFTAFATFQFSRLSLAATQTDFIINNLFFGFGLGLFMVPLTTYSLATLPQKNITEAAGLFSYGRMLGTSVGVSLLSTLIARETQINWLQLNENISVFNNNFRTWLYRQHLGAHNPKAIVELKMNLMAQSSMIAFVDAFYLMSILLLCFIPLVLCLKTVRLKEGAVNTGH